MAIEYTHHYSLVAYYAQEKNSKFETNPDATFGGFAEYLGGLSSLIGDTKAGDPMVRGTIYLPCLNSSYIRASSSSGALVEVCVQIHTLNCFVFITAGTDETGARGRRRLRHSLHSVQREYVYAR